MPMIKVGDINIEYYLEGDGPPLLMIHGLGASAHDWGDRFRDELRRHFQLVRFSNRGTGQTDKPQLIYSAQMMAADAAGLLKELGITKAHVLGVSLGGVIAQQMALDHPQVIQGLVLACSGFGGSEGVSASPEIIALLVPTPGLSPEDQIRKAWPAVYTPRFIEEERDYLEERLLIHLAHPTPPDTLGRQIVVATQSNTYEGLPKIEAPTLVIHGDQDVLVPVENAHILHDRIPNSTLHILPGLGHGVFGEKPQESAQAITKFLSSITSAVGQK